jgi:zinc transport system substrate-binding protein
MGKLVGSMPCLAVLVAILLGGAPAARGDELRVVASIKPLQSLVASVMAGVGVPELVVPGAASPHTYALKPSDARRLTGARVVFWIGPMYEAFLVRPLEVLAPSARIVALGGAPGVEILPARHGGEWLADEHEHEHGAEGGGVETRDGHLWLDPKNAVAMVAAIAAALGDADPAHAARYVENAAATRARLDRLDRDLAARLEPARGVPFIVFHDAYQYFERRYGLTAIGSVAVSPESRPGARRVSALRGKIAGMGARCVFTEPQFEPSLVRTLIAGTKAHTAILDPLGADVPGGPELYFIVMGRVAASLRECLGEAPR